SPRNDRRTDLDDAVRIEDSRRAVARHHLRVDDLLRRGRRPPAPLLGPEDRGPAAVVQFVLPSLALVHDAHDAARRVEVIGLGPLLDERRHLLVEERLELLFEREVFRRQCEVHGADDSVRFRWTSRSRRSRKRCATQCARSCKPKRRRSTCGSCRSTTTPASLPKCGTRSCRWGGRGCSCRKPKAVSVSASSTRSSYKKRWAARPSRGRSSRRRSSR